MFGSKGGVTPSTSVSILEGVNGQARERRSLHARARVCVLAALDVLNVGPTAETANIQVGVRQACWGHQAEGAGAGHGIE